MMKNALTVLILLALALNLLTGFAIAESARDRVLATQKSYLSAYEEMESIDQWAMQWVDAFFSEPNFENLLRADAAVSTAKQAFLNILPPVESVQPEDLVELYEENADVVWIGEWYDMFSIAQKNYTLRYTRIENMLLCDAVYLPFHAAAIEQIASDKEYQMYNRLSTCHEINYLLLQLGGSEADWKTYAAQYPRLFAEHPSWDADEDHLIAEEENVLSAIEAYDLLGDRWIALVEYNYDQLDKARTDDTETPLADVLAVPDAINRVYPQPVWYCADNYVYFAASIKDGEAERLTRVHDDLTQTPNAGILMVQNVSCEEVKAYAAHLSGYGFEPRILTDTDMEYSCLIGYDDCPMHLSWKAREGAYISFLRGVGCMIPEWMLQL